MRKVFMISGICLGFFRANAQTDWTAPKEADQLKNPFKGKKEATLAGKKTFTQMCVVCHGESGKGDGIAGKNLKPQPGNYTTAQFQAQTDGAIFWKMTNGKGAMAAYGNILSETQRWQLVNYIRTFAPKK